MKRLLNWLAKEARGKTYWFLVLSVPVIGIFYSVCIGLVFDLFDIYIPPVPAIRLNAEIWIFLLIMFAFIPLEEILFRGHLVLAVKKYGKSVKVLIVAVLLSVIFGWIHGGIIHIFIQGVNGFVWCLLFLKSGGFQQRYIKAFATTIAVHSMYNGIIFASIFL